MEIQHIKEFVVLAETCSFQEAAGQLYISLSSLSKHIAKMEEELGVPLFDRTTRSVELSKYGVVFLEYAQQIVKLSTECSGALYEMQVGDANKLSIGFLPMLGQFGIIEMLSDFSQHHPDISLNMVESQEPKELIRLKQCDFVFDVDDSHNEHDIKQRIYMVDHLVAVLPLNHPLAKEEHVTIEQLRDQRFVIHSESPRSASMVVARKFRELCLSAGFKPNVSMTAAFTSNIVRLVSQGQGIAILSHAHVPTSASSSVVIVNIFPIVPFYIYALFLKDRVMSTAAVNFLNYLKERERTSFTHP